LQALRAWSNGPPEFRFRAVARKRFETIEIRSQSHQLELDWNAVTSPFSGSDYDLSPSWPASFAAVPPSEQVGPLQIALDAVIGAGILDRSEMAAGDATGGAMTYTWWNGVSWRGGWPLQQSLASIAAGGSRTSLASSALMVFGSHG
jgi:hypothetical protein